MESHFYLSRIAVQNARYFVFGFIFLVIAVTLVVPVPASALEQLDCKTGTRLVRMQGYTGWYFSCVDKDGVSVAPPAEKTVSSCTSGYKRVLSTWQAELTSPDTNGNKCVPDSTPAADERHSSPTDCSIGWTNLGAIFSPTCWGRTASVLIGTALISIAAWLLTAVGLLFNVLVNNTIITFGYLFNEQVGAAVGTAWSAFRDIANIVIIGMFVFIAINMILGVKEFGDKKKVARVLIIAVLLNFSLLFTKVIIDASNFTAMQFYKMSQLSAEGESGSLSFATFEKKGISGQFIDLLGLKTLSETSNALSSASFGSESDQYKSANGWTALLHGLVSATLLLAAALVLLYCCFLLAFRAF